MEQFQSFVQKEKNQGVNQGQRTDIAFPLQLFPKPLRSLLYFPISRLFKILALMGILS